MGVSQDTGVTSGLNARNYLNILNSPTPAGRVTLPKVACIGSSYTQQQTTFSSTTLTRTNRSWMGWWNTFTGGALNIDDFYNASDPLSRNYSGSNFGVSGQDSTQILNRVSAVISSQADICVIQSGSNNVTAPTTVIADVKASIDLLYAAGILTVYLGISNRGSASWSSNEPAQAYRINQEIKDYCKRTGKGIFIDPNFYLIDNSDNNGRPYTNALDSDGIHYNDYSGFQIGKILHQCITPLLPLQSCELAGFTDAYDATNQPYGNIVTNPFFTTSSSVGSANGTVGAGVTAGTGNAATSVGRNVTVERNSGSGTAVANLEARGAGRGNWQTVMCTPAGSAGTSVFYVRRGTADLTTGVPPVGTWVQGTIDVDVSTFGSDALYSGFRAISSRIECRDASTLYGTVIAMSNYSTSFNLPNESWSGRIVTPPFQIPTSTDRIRYRNEITIDDAMTGTGTVKLGSLCIRPIQEPKTIWGF